MTGGGGNNVIAAPKSAISVGFSAVLLLTGCGSAGSFSQSQLDVITDNCELPRSAIVLRGKDELLFQPPVDAKYEAVDCALQKLKEAKFPGMKMGFVGNERYSNEVEQ